MSGEHALRQLLASPAAKGCRCGIRPTMTYDELRARGAGCTAPRWVCPILDKARAQVSAAQRRQKVAG